MLMAMDFVMARLRGGRHGDQGSAIVEYSLLLALITVACIGAVQKFGIGVSHVFQTGTAAL